MQGRGLARPARISTGPTCTPRGISGEDCLEYAYRVLYVASTLRELITSSIYSSSPVPAPNNLLRCALCMFRGSRASLVLSTTTSENAQTVAAGGARPGASTRRRSQPVARRSVQAILPRECRCINLARCWYAHSMISLVKAMYKYGRSWRTACPSPPESRSSVLGWATWRVAAATTPGLGPGVR